MGGSGVAAMFSGACVDVGVGHLPARCTCGVSSCAAATPLTDSRVLHSEAGCYSCEPPIPQAGLALPLVAFALLMPPVSLKAGGAAAVRSPATAGAGQRQQQLQQHQGLPSSGGLVGGVRGVSSPGGAAVWPLAELHLTEVHHRERPPAANPHRSTIDSTAGAAGALEHSASTLRVPLVAGFECSSSQRHADLLSLAHAGQPTAAGSGTLAAGEGTDPWDGGPAGITSGREGHARRRQEGAEKLLPAAGPDSVHVDSGVLGTGEGSGLLPGSGVATAGCRTSTGAWAGDGWLGKRDGVRAPGCMGRITTMLRDLKQVVVYPACVCNNVGYAPIQWIFGIVTFWGPKALQDVFRWGKTGGACKVFMLEGRSAGVRPVCLLASAGVRQRWQLPLLTHMSHQAASPQATCAYCGNVRAFGILPSASCLLPHPVAPVPAG